MSDTQGERHPLDELAEDYLERRRRGERPTIQEYVQRYPEHGEEIRELFPAMLILEQARPPFAVAEVGPPERLGDFRMVREVGRGGMGIVYEAEQLSLGRRVALKLLPRHALLAPGQVQRFEREVRAAARLHHSNIVPVYGVGQHDGLHYYVMQLIDGCSLEQVSAALQRGPVTASSADAVRPAGGGASTARQGLGDRTQLPGRPASFAVVHAADEEAALPSVVPGPETWPANYWRWVARLGVEVAEALEYAHRQGILHRDIKPSNLLLDGGGRVWVTDFGLAKAAAEAADGPAAATGSGDVVGTIRYMAPERFQGRADARSDVYSLGLTLYELLARRPAFDAQDRVALMHQAVHAEPPRLRKLDPRLPRDLETIVAKTLEKDVGRRYGSAAQLADDLKRFLDDRPVRARRVSPLERARRWCRRNPLAACLTAVLVLLAAISYAVILYEMGESRASGETARRERDEARRANERLQQAYYAANMKLAADAWAAPGGLRRTRELLDLGRPRPGDRDLRGFEWHYLHRLSHPDCLVLRGHTGSVRSLAYSADGGRLISTSSDGTVRVWNARDGQQILCWPSHASWVGGLALSPDGRTLATAGHEADKPGSPTRSAIRLWDVHSGSARGLIAPPAALRVFAVEFSPDGQRLLAAGGLPRGSFSDHQPVLKVFAVATGTELLSVNDVGLGGASFSPDGRRIAALTSATGVKVLDARSGAVALTIGSELRLTGLAWSPDGRWLAGGHARGVRVWDAQTGQEVWKAPEQFADVRCVAFSPDGRRLAAGWSQDGSVRLHDAATGQEIGRFRGHEGGLTALAFSPDGRSLTTGSSDRTLTVWDLRTDQAPLVLDVSGSGQVVGLALSRDGSRLVSRHDRMGRPADAPRFTTHVWDLRTGEKAWSVPEGCSPGIGAAPEGERLATWTADGTITVRDLATGQELLHQRASLSQIREVLLSADGEKLVTLGFATDDRTNLFVPAAAVCSARNGETLPCRLPPGRAMLCAALSPDGSHLVEGWGRKSGDEEGFALVVWNLERGTKVASWESEGGGALGILTAWFSPDGRRLATLHKDSVVRVWDPWLGRELLNLRGHTSVVRGAAFSPDGRRLATAAFDQSVRLWDLETGHELLTLQNGGLFTSVAFDSEGRRLAAGYGSQVTVWQATPQAESPQGR